MDKYKTPLTLKFVGKFTDLISMGFKFQKLYASKYICYVNEGIFIWRKGKEMTCMRVSMTQKDEAIIDLLFERGMVEN
jgi:hypothetical protein